MDSDNGEWEGAVGGIDRNQEADFCRRVNESALLDDLIDISNLKLDEGDDQNWLTSSICKPTFDLDVNDKSIEEWINMSSAQFLRESAITRPGGVGDTSFHYANASHLSNKSLVNKLDRIARGSPTVHNISSGTGSGAGTSICSSNLSPSVSSYLRQNLSSTPASKGHSTFDPRTFKRPQQKYLDAAFSTPLNGRISSHSSNSSANQLSNLNISDISIAECSPLLGIGETPTSSTVQPAMNLTFDSRRGSSPFSSSPRKGKTFNTSLPKATNATFDKLQYQDQQGLNTTYNFGGQQTGSNNEQHSSANPHVPCIHDNPNSTFDIPDPNKSNANATFTYGENGVVDNSSSSNSVNLRKITYAIASGNSSISRINNSVSNEQANANTDMTYDYCDTADPTGNCSNKQSGDANNFKNYNVQKLSRDSSQGM